MNRDLLMDIDRLAVPKRRQPFSDGEEVNMSGLPPDPLPTWTTLPLDYKLPMIPGPKGAVSLFTTNLGEKIHKKTHEVDFDLTDPYSLFMSNYYKPLHDPHLKLHLTTPQMKRRLYKDGFITRDGKVLCTLKEFNDYRQYLRKINLLIEKRKERQNKAASTRTQLTKKDTEAALLQHMREQKVKDIRERLAKQYEEDRARYLQQIREQEDKHRKIKQEQLARMSEKECKLREEDERRQYMVHKRHLEERKRKLGKLRKWIYEDAERFARSQKRRQDSEKERQKKLEETWEQRKQQQQQRLEEERERQQTDREEMLRRIKDREQRVGKQWGKQSDVYKTMIERQKRERERVEQIYAENLTKRLDRKRAFLAAERKRKKRGKRFKRGRLQSIWDIGETLMNIVSLEDLKEEDEEGGGSSMEKQDDKDLVKPSGDGLAVPDISVVKSEVSEPPPSFDRLQLPDGSNIFPEEPSTESISPRPSALDIYHILKGHRKIKDRRPTPAVDDDIGYMRTKLIDEGRLAAEGEEILEEEEEEEEEDADLDDMGKAAKAIVDLSMYITTQVIYPAYMKWLEQDHPDEYRNELEKYPHTKLPEEKSERRARGSVQFSDRTDILPPSHVMFAHGEEGDGEGVEEGAEGSGDEEDEPRYDRRLSLSYKDSLTRLMSHTDFRHGGTMAQELEDILKDVLEELASGKLNNNQIKDLIDIARNILDSLQMLSSQEEEDEEEAAVTPAMISSPSSQTSTMAREIVQQTLERVKQELLADSEFLELSGRDMGPPVSPARSVASLAEFIVNKAVTSAVHSLQAVGGEEDQGESRGKARTPGRPTSAPPTPQTHRLPDVIQEEPPFQVKTAESELVWTVLRRTAKEVESEIMKANPTKEPSQMSTFVKHVLSQAAQELVSRSSGNWVDWSRKQSRKQVDSSSSDISYFVQYTISKVLRDMEEEGLIPATDKDFPKSASSLFVSNLVDMTLQQCLDELNEELLPKTDLVSVAAAIIESHQDLKTGSSIHKPAESLAKSFSNIYQDEKDPTRQSSMLVEAFVKETLSKVFTDLKSGKMSMDEIHVLAQAFGRVSERDSMAPTELRLQQSLEAQYFVEAALGNVLQELSSQQQTSASQAEPLGKVETVDKAFDEVIDELHTKTLPVKSESSAELEHFIKTVLTNVKKETHQMVQTHGLEDKSSSQQSLEYFINDLIDKNASELAKEQGFRYQETRSTPSLNILVCETPKSSTESVDETTVLSRDTSAELKTFLSDILEQSSRPDSADLPVSDVRDTEVSSQTPSMEELSSFIESIMLESSPQHVPVQKAPSPSHPEIEPQKDKRLRSKSSKEIKAIISDIIADHSTEMGSRKSSKELNSFIDDLIHKSCKDTQQKGAPSSDEQEALKQKHGVTESESLQKSDSSKELSSLISKIMTQSMKDMKILNDIDGTSTETPVKLAVADSPSVELNKLVGNTMSTHMDEPQPKTPYSSVADVQVSNKSSEGLSSYIKMIISDAAGNLVKNVMSSALISSGENQDRPSNNGMVSPIIRTEEVEDDDDEKEDEAPITAMFHDKLLPLEHSIIEDALSVISVKKDHDLHHIHQYEAVPRNSFLSLQHPEIEKVKRLSHNAGSDKEMCEKIINMSSKCMEVLKHEGESSESSSSSGSSSGSEEMLESTEKVLSVVNIHDVISGPDTNEIGTELTKDTDATGTTKSKTSSPYGMKLSHPKVSATKSGSKQKSSSTSLSPKNTKVKHDSSDKSMSPQDRKKQETNSKSLLSAVQKSNHVRSTSYPRIKEKKEPDVVRRNSESPLKVGKKSSTKDQKSDVSSTSLKKQVSKDSSVKSVNRSTSGSQTRRLSDKKLDKAKPSQKSIARSTSNDQNQPKQSAVKIVASKSDEQKVKSSDEVEVKESVEPLSDIQQDQIDMAGQSETVKQQASGELSIFISDVIRNSFANLQTSDIDNHSQLKMNTESMTKPDVVPMQDLSVNEATDFEERKSSESRVEEGHGNIKCDETEIGGNQNLESTADRALGLVEDDMAEIEEDIQPTRRKISAKKSSRSSQSSYSPTVTLSDKDVKQKSSSNTIEMISNFPKSSKTDHSPRGSSSSVKSKRSGSSSHRTSHDAMSLTPRPSSGFSKSPTPFNVTACESGGLNHATSGGSVASRIMKSISSLGDKILGRKSPSIENKSNTSSDHAQPSQNISSRGSVVTLPDIKSSSTKPTSTTNSSHSQEAACKKSKSSKTTLDEMSKTTSPVNLSLKQSQSHLSANNSIPLDVQQDNSSTVRYTHSDPDEEDMLSSPNQQEVDEQQEAAGHNHHHHHHHQDPVTTGSLPDLGSQSYSLLHRNHHHTHTKNVSSLPKQSSSKSVKK